MVGWEGDNLGGSQVSWDTKYSGHSDYTGGRMGEGQVGRIPSIPGYVLSIPDTVTTVGRMGGGQLGRIPSIPGY